MGREVKEDAEQRIGARLELALRHPSVPIEAEIDKLMMFARPDARHGHREGTAILVRFPHGLRASELVSGAGGGHHEKDCDDPMNDLDQ
jgi:hypothetical protein